MALAIIAEQEATMETTAGTKVLATPELLETILLMLPMRKILLFQRVDKFWQASIINSPRLQRKLFFRRSEATDKAPRLNPMARSRYHPDRDDYTMYLWQGESSECHVKILEVAGLVQPKFDECASVNKMLLTDQECPIRYAQFADWLGAVRCRADIKGRTFGEVMKEVRKLRRRTLRSSKSRG